MSIKNLTALAAITAVTAMTKIEDVRDAATAFEITFSGNSGIETIREKVLEKLQEKAIEEDNAAQDDAKATEEAKKAKKAQKAADKKAAEKAKADEANENKDDDDPTLEEDYIQVTAAPIKSKYSNEDLMKMDPSRLKDPTLRRAAMRAQQLLLQRVEIQMLDPSEANVPGNVITIYNKYIGKVSHYVPNNTDETGKAWHLPKVIIDLLLTKTYIQRKKVGQTKFGVQQYKNVNAKKYAITILPPLTEDEIAALALEQKASGSID